MAKNYMADVANMLGVELGEEFKIDSSDTIFKFYKNGLCFQCGGAWLRADSNLIDLIKGDSKIVKLPWQPKYNEIYYRPWRNFTGATSEYEMYDVTVPPDKFEAEHIGVSNRQEVMKK